MKHKLLAVLLIVSSFGVNGQTTTTDNIFVVAPYLQIGAAPSAQSLQLLWHSVDAATTWTAEYKVTGDGPWIQPGKTSRTRIAIAGIQPYNVYRVSLTGLIPGNIFTYRVLKGGKEVFTAKGHALKSANQPFRFVASGDMGAGTKEAKQIANRIFEANPDFVAIAGDIVYDYGLISEYKTKFWPIYNADKIDTLGVPLMRSVPFVAAVGNHDADTRDLDKYPDALAYYLFWDQPLNGPVGKEGGTLVPTLQGSAPNKKAFLTGAGDRYPRMANFSFNYSNAHWTVIDADTYVDWTDSTLRDWVAKDLAGSGDADWRFVLFHHPGFNSAKTHYEQQQMRLLAPIFEKGNVDIVFNGHVHNYQRSFPMTFIPEKNGTLLIGGRDGKTVKGRVVNGNWTLDKTFDGKSNTKPKGVIYIITGAGGQALYNPEQNNDPDSWQKFTDKFFSIIHSITVVDVNGKELKLRQLAADGREIDSIMITK